MPEQDKNERALPGDTSVSHSSDEYIAGNLSRIEGEVYAVDNSEVEIDVYAPQQIGSVTTIDHNEVEISPKPLSIVNELKGTDSAFGVRVLRTRKRELKKAA